MKRYLTFSDYHALAELRHQIRCFIRFSEQAARDTGLEPRQHQLMLALKGLPKDVRPTIGELAKRLQIEHHSAVELANRLASGGFVRRHPGNLDRREVFLALTAKGNRVLRALSIHHWSELRTRGPELISALKRITQSKKGPRLAAPRLKRPEEKN